MDVRIKRYTPSDKGVWNGFIEESKNGLFLFNRQYMDYHADRFIDHSLLFFKKEELICVLPANEKEGLFNSHGGLTYGGLIISKRASIIFVQQAFNELIHYLKSLSFHSFIYKSIPCIFHKQPAQEDLYALFITGAELFRRDASSVIDLTQKASYTKGTKSNLSKARKAGLQVHQSKDYDVFMAIETEILNRKFNTKPTHSAEEIKLLAERFPGNIKLFLVFKDGECLGGTIIYETENVVHTQYIGITEIGKETGALDFLTDYLLSLFRNQKKYFSFGISTEDEGRHLNEGLIRNKESFGARTIVNDFYKIAL